LFRIVLTPIWIWIRLSILMAIQILPQVLQLLEKKFVFYFFSLSLLLIEMDADPDPASDRQALDADPDPAK
jgi:hypothetical protein